MGENELEMTRKLLVKGAEPNVGFCARRKLTPLQKASSQGAESLVQLLVKYGADATAHPTSSKGAQPYKWQLKMAMCLWL